MRGDQAGPVRGPVEQRAGRTSSSAARGPPRRATSASRTPTSRRRRPREPGSVRHCAAPSPRRARASPGTGRARARRARRGSRRSSRSVSIGGCTTARTVPGRTVWSWRHISSPALLEHDRHHRHARLHRDVERALLERAEPRRHRAGALRRDEQRHPARGPCRRRACSASRAWRVLPRSTNATSASWKSWPNSGMLLRLRLRDAGEVVAQQLHEDDRVELALVVEDEDAGRVATTGARRPRTSTSDAGHAEREVGAERAGEVDHVLPRAVAARPDPAAAADAAEEPAVEADGAPDRLHAAGRRRAAGRAGRRRTPSGSTATGCPTRSSSGRSSSVPYAKDAARSTSCVVGPGEAAAAASAPRADRRTDPVDLSRRVRRTTRVVDDVVGAELRGDRIDLGPAWRGRPARPGARGGRARRRAATSPGAATTPSSPEASGRPRRRPRRRRVRAASAPRARRRPGSRRRAPRRRRGCRRTAVPGRSRTRRTARAGTRRAGRRRRRRRR